jgi:hypothetical protein
MGKSRRLAFLAVCVLGGIAALLLPRPSWAQG